VNAYDFLAPPRITFGWGRRMEVGRLAREYGRRAFLIVGSRALESAGAIDEIRAALREAGIEVVDAAAIHREPLVEDVDRAVALLRDRGAGAGDVVVAVGGGSALDLGKAAAALATNRQGTCVLEYLEGVGRGLAIVEPPLPLIALPTTAGTGSEATKNAVISCLDPAFKKSLRDDRMIARVALVDPELTVGLPAETTAWTGMDAITQLIESYITRNARPIPQALALAGLRLAVPALPAAVSVGSDRAARETMSQAALLSGLALANSGLGLAHGVAAALGVHCGLPHGLACAVMLPAAMRVNRPVRQAEFAALAAALTDRGWPNEAAAADAAVEVVVALCRRLNVPAKLSTLGVRAEQIPALVRGSRGNSMNGNPRDVSDEELAHLLEEML